MSCAGVGSDIGIGRRGLGLNVPPAGGVSWLEWPARSCSGNVFAVSGGDGGSSMVGAFTGVHSHLPCRTFFHYQLERHV